MHQKIKELKKRIQNQKRTIHQCSETIESLLQERERLMESLDEKEIDLVTTKAEAFDLMVQNN